MAKGAVAAIKQNISSSTIQRVGSRATRRVLTQQATAKMGGLGPVRQDTTSVFLKGTP